MLMLTSELIVRDMEVLAMSLLKFLRAIFSFLKLKKKVTSPTLVIVFFYQWSDKTTPT